MSDATEITLEEIAKFREFERLTMRFQAIDHAREMAMRHAAPDAIRGIESLFNEQANVILERMNALIDETGGFSSRLLTWICAADNQEEAEPTSGGEDGEAAA